MAFIAPEKWSQSASSHRRIDVSCALKKNRIFPESPEFCLALDRNNTNEKSVLTLRRIGSESSDAEVYEVDTSGWRAALKLMPVLSDSHSERNIREILFAESVSEIVSDGICPNFPLVYSSGFCEKVELFKAGKFNNAMLEYASTNALRKCLPSQNTIISRLFKAKRPIGEIMHRVNVSPDQCALPKYGYAHYLVSELANEDMISWSSRNHSEKDWKDMMKQVIDAISAMKRIKISHNDLHLGNVLVLHETEGDIALVHDFGHTTELDDSNQTTDIVKFMNAVESVRSLPESIFDFIGEMAPYIDSGQTEKITKALQ